MSNNIIKFFDFLANLMDYIAILYFVFLLFMGGVVDLINLTIIFLLVFFRVIAMVFELINIYKTK